ncbi:MAG: hypothetical protein QOJ91_3078 [Sphingomonadales bacterium]|jgi:RNA polymerase sigma-70 factor (ECF subfamily)|nr:hypothetical protein [Sphingomonadales bacterium]
MKQAQVDREGRTDEDSVDSVVAINRETLRQTWKTSYPAFLSRAMLWSRGNRISAEDLVSRATVRILSFISAQDHPVADMRALYFTVLRNLAIDEYRNARRGDSLFDRSVDIHSDADAWRLPAGRADTHEELVRSQSLAAVEAVLERLSEETRILFVQRFLEHRSYGEIAPVLGISEAGARKRIQKLRTLLDSRMRPALDERVTDRAPARLTSRTC